MELQLKAQAASSNRLIAENSSATIAKKPENRPAILRFFNKCKQCKNDEALIATLTLAACGCILAVLLAAAQATDFLMNLGRP